LPQSGRHSHPLGSSTISRHPCGFFLRTGGSRQAAWREARAISAVLGMLAIAFPVTARAAHHDARPPCPPCIHASPANVGRLPLPAPDHRTPVPARRHAALVPHRAAHPRRAWTRPPGGLCSSEVRSASPLFESTGPKGLRSPYGCGPDASSHSERGPPCGGRNCTELRPPNLLNSPPHSAPVLISTILARRSGHPPSGVPDDHGSTERGFVDVVSEVFDAR
jgi:hypothetical protein